MDDFPIFKNREIVYLDNAATTQKPQVVIDKLRNFYENNNANAHRGVYKLSEDATTLLEEARKVFAGFVNAKKENIIFTKSATEGLNMIANSLEKTFIFDKEDNIVVTEIDHHSNFLPWQQLCKRTGAEFRVVKYDLKKQDIEDISRYVDDNTKIAAFTAMSNVSGLMIDVKEQISKIRKKNKDTIIIIDATQYVAHNKIDWGADFFVFSAHKIYGTTGVGIIYGKTKFLEKIEPFNYGGNMISSVDIKESTWADIPDRFEAGTIDAAGIIASERILWIHENRGCSKELCLEEIKGNKRIKDHWA